jgi:hypothetical protein
MEERGVAKRLRKKLIKNWVGFIEKPVKYQLSFLLAPNFLDCKQNFQILNREKN